MGYIIMCVIDLSFLYSVFEKVSEEHYDLIRTSHGEYLPFDRDQMKPIVGSRLHDLTEDIRQNPGKYILSL